MAWHPCQYWQCCENYHGECYGMGCRLNPTPAPSEHYLYDDAVPFAEDETNDESDN